MMCLFVCFLFSNLKYRNKKPPYETMCSETKHLAGYQMYTSEGCYTECLSNATVRKCGCRSASDSGEQLKYTYCYIFSVVSHFIFPIHSGFFVFNDFQL